ncbi:hypothetical protein Lesp02_70780 [Lentzea sp. NBRC 105346]|uniref:hypothetical protein n=1 Tax=Lentzea sp. NBRC 105346 TaxID=3032205 RepID=UPI0024A3C135|nr:hypothetical protein [Lentzea sp. NBRC 105346]GLZ34891.1 hypothetical protein Lesp02_70780 [Lentzea sp. NBRC 105346]
MIRPKTEAAVRALRTLVQNLAVDVAVAVVVAVSPLVVGTQLDWRLIAVTAGKTALATAVSFAHRKLDELRAKNTEG